MPVTNTDPQTVTWQTEDIRFANQPLGLTWTLGTSAKQDANHCNAWNSSEQPKITPKPTHWPQVATHRNLKLCCWPCPPVAARANGNTKVEPPSPSPTPSPRFCLYFCPHQYCCLCLCMLASLFLVARSMICICLSFRLSCYNCADEHHYWLSEGSMGPENYDSDQSGLFRIRRSKGALTVEGGSNMAAPLWGQYAIWIWNPNQFCPTQSGSTHVTANIIWQGLPFVVSPRVWEVVGSTCGNMTSLQIHLRGWWLTSFGGRILAIPNHDRADALRLVDLANNGIISVP